MTYNTKDLYYKVKDHPDLVDVIPDEMATSFPVPVLSHNNGTTKLQFAFFHFTMTRGSSWGAPPGTSYILSPRRKTTVNYPELKIISSEPATSLTFGVEWDDSKPVGEYTENPSITLEAILKKEDRFFELYNIILPLYITNSTPLNNNIKKDINEFTNLFPEVGHPSLMPYYKGLNPDFFQWLDKHEI